MKKLLMMMAALVLAAVAYAAQPQNIGTVTTEGLGLPNYTLALMNALTSDTTGQTIYVSDAVRSRVCTSSGTTAPGQWVIAVATGNFTAASYPHCL